MFLRQEGQEQRHLHKVGPRNVLEISPSSSKQLDNKAWDSTKIGVEFINFRNYGEACPRTGKSPISQLSFSKGGGFGLRCRGKTDQMEDTLLRWKEPFQKTLPIHMAGRVSGLEFFHFQMKNLLENVNS